MATFRRLGQSSPEINIKRAPGTKDGIQLTSVQQWERAERLRASRKKTTDFTSAVLLRLNLLGFVAWRNNNIPSQVTRIKVDADGKEHRTTRYKSNNVYLGTLDIIGFRKRDGRHVEIEIKTKAKKKDTLSPEQKRQLEKLKSAFCISFVTENLDDFEIQIKPFL